ncbi:MAG: hypothetical protein V4689_12995 [Verrucomicrobiota bacterium]
MDTKRTYTPTEFAALFGKEKSWTYRQLYAGKIEAITDFGRIQIAASQVEKIESNSGSYLGKKRSRMKPVIEISSKKAPSSSNEGGSNWSSKVSARRRSLRTTLNGQKDVVRPRNNQESGTEE